MREQPSRTTGAPLLLDDEPSTGSEVELLVPAGSVELVLVCGVGLLVEGPSLVVVPCELVPAADVLVSPSGSDATLGSHAMRETNETADATPSRVRDDGSTRLPTTADVSTFKPRDDGVLPVAVAILAGCLAGSALGDGRHEIVASDVDQVDSLLEELLVAGRAHAASLATLAPRLDELREP